MQIIVLGMHRSGTSLLTRLINMMGAYVGGEGFGLTASPTNPKGFWERQDIMDVNDALLRAVDCEWDRPLDFSIDLLDANLSAQLEKKARGIVLGLDAHRPWVAKDPRFCLTLPFWTPFLEVPVGVHVARNPLEIARSLQTRNQMPIPVGIALWECYELACARNAARWNCLSILHHDLIRDPVAVVKRLHADLTAASVRNLQLPGEREITAFTDAKLYRARSQDDELEQFLLPAQAEVWRLLSQDDFAGLAARTLSPASEQALRGYKGMAKSLDENKNQLSKLRNELKSIKEKPSGPALAAQPAPGWGDLSKQLEIHYISQLQTATQLLIELKSACDREVLQQQTRVEQSRQESGQLRGKLTELETTLRQRAAQIGTLEKGGVELKAKLQAKEQQTTNLERTLGERAAEVAALVGALDERAAEVEGARQETEELRRQAGERAAEVAALEGALDERAAEVEGARQETEELRRQARERATRVAELQGMLSELETRRRHQFAQAQALQSALRQRDQQLVDISGQYEDAGQALRVLQEGWLWRWSKRLRSLPEWFRIGRGRGLGAVRRLRMEYALLSHSGLFDAGYYLGRRPRLAASGQDPLLQYLLGDPADAGDPNPLFDGQWYLERYPDVAAEGLNPLVHYLLHGVKESRDPNPVFDTDWYLERYPDVAAAGLNPLVHYLRHGAAEERDPGPGFIARRYRRQHPELAAKNVSLLTHRLRYHRDFPSDSADVLTDLLENGTTDNKLCIIFHVYHKDIVPESVEFIKNIEEGFDLVVTTPLDESDAIIVYLKSAFPNVKIVRFPNKGRDIRPFINLIDKLEKYDLCCKIHTKRGLTGKGDLWRKVCFESLLGSKDNIREIINTFRADPRIMMIGPDLLYKCGNSLILKNKELIEHLMNIIGIRMDINQKWGFFAGSMFWFRPKLFIKLSGWNKINFPDETGSVDGSIEHAIERVLGMLLTDQKVRIGFVPWPIHKDFKVKVLEAPGEPDHELPSHSLSKLVLSKFNDSGYVKRVKQKLNMTIRGGLNLNSQPVLRGWVAEIGNPQPRIALLKIDSAHDIELCCDIYRHDLKANNVNNGRHAFEVTVPSDFCDGKNHEIMLIDKLTGKQVDSRKATWNSSVIRKFSDFAGFLANSLVSPVIRLPFREEDRRCFAVMENVANYLVTLSEAAKSEHLVSVIMPVHNRIDTLKTAVDSVLVQRYKNFELIIVDDGSDDGSLDLIKSTQDPRIVLLHNSSCQGVSRARNRALSAARGKYLTYLDSDNTWDDRYLAAVVGAFAKLPDAGALYGGQLLYHCDNQQPFAIRFGGFNRSLLENSNYIDLNSFAHTYEVYARQGGFDEKLRRFVDWDLIKRIAKNERVYSVPVLLTHYFYDKANNTLTNNQKFLPDLELVRNKRNENSHAEKKLGFAPCKNVSIIIPNYESLEYVRECIESIQAQLINDWVEIIVVDNASSQVVVDYLTELAESKVIDLIENDINFGFTYAVNQGIARSRNGNDILLLNNDAVLTPGSLEALQKAAYHLPQCAMTVPQQVLPGGTKTILNHVPYANAAFECDVNISAHHDNVLNPPLFHAGETLELGFAPFFCVYIRRDALQGSQGLDAEHGRHYRSDRIFCDYVRHVMNKKIYHVSDAVVYHKLQKSTDYLRKKSDDFDMIFKKNQWDAELAERLGFKRAAWDI